MTTGAYGSSSGASTELWDRLQAAEEAALQLRARSDLLLEALLWLCASSVRLDLAQVVRDVTGMALSLTGADVAAWAPGEDTGMDLPPFTSEEKGLETPPTVEDLPRLADVLWRGTTVQLDGDVTARGITATSMRENDFVTQLFSANTRDYAYFFTTLGRVFRLRVHEIPEGSRTSRGTAAINVLALTEGERLSAVIPLRDARAEGDTDPAEEAPRYLICATQAGYMKRIPLSALANVRRSGIIAIDLGEGDRLISVRLCREDEEILAGSTKGRVIRFGVGEIRVMGRTARGVRAMRLADGDLVIGLSVAEADADVLLVSEGGIGKRTRVQDFPLHHRGGQGVRALRLSQRSGRLVALRVVHPTDEVMLISAQGILTRQRVDGISRQGRSATGVTLMRLDKDDTLVAVAALPGGGEAELVEE